MPRKCSTCGEEMVPVSFVIEKGLLKTLSRLAKRNKMPVQRVIRAALRQWVARKENA
jgi:predicted transcriptional regulator